LPVSPLRAQTYRRLQDKAGPNARRIVMRRLSRSALVCVLALVVGLGAGSAVATGATPVKGNTGAMVGSAAVVSGTFVGKADGGVQVGVAVVAQRPAAAGQARTISLYVSNGNSLSVWLTGQTAGNTADLRSVDGRFGAQVTVAALTSTGKVGLPGGSGFRFTARREAVAGLFDVLVAANGTLRGTSSGGATLSGRLGRQGTPAANLTAVVSTTASSSVMKLAAPTRQVKPGSYRVIVLPDRTVFGANLRGTAFGAIGGVVLQLGKTGILRPVGPGLPTGKGTLRIQAGGAGQPGYGNAKCGDLANKFNQLSAMAEQAILKGDEALADKAGEAATAIMDELDDHCLVVY
jgi:hypothetical protein